MPPWCGPPTVGPWCRPTCSSRAGTSGWTGRRRVDVGRKAIAANAADIEAMGATPTAFVVAFGAPGDTAADDVMALSDGMWQEARVIGAGIVGGDLVSAPQWVISVTALGELGGREPVVLRGAKPGRHWRAVGELGWSAAGYALWYNVFDELRRDPTTPPGAAGALRRGAGRGRCGRHGDDRRLRRAAGRPRPHRSARRVSASTCPGRPCPPITKRSPRPPSRPSADAWAWVFGGGEDHALVATFPGPLPPGWRRIGVVVDGPSRVLVDGNPWQEVRAGSRSERPAAMSSCRVPGLH